MRKAPKSKTSGAVFTGFSHDGENFVVIAPDGRTRVFETSNGRCFINMAAGSSTSVGASTSADLIQAYCWGWLEDGKPGIFLGGRAGSLKALDVTNGGIKWASVEEGGLLGLCWHEGQVLSSTNVGCLIKKYDSLNGTSLATFKAGKHPPAHIKGVPGSKRILAGSSVLSLWDVTEEEQIAKYVGHATPITALDFSPDGKFGLSTAEGERYIALWNTANPEKKKNKAVCTLSTDSPVKEMSTLRLGKKKKEFIVAALSTSGKGYVWNCHTKKASKVEATLWATVQVGNNGNQKRDGILSIKLERKGGASSLILARGNTGKPVFERIALPELESKPAVVNLENLEGGMMILDAPSEDGKKKKRKREVVLGPDNEGEEVLIGGKGHGPKRSMPMDNGLLEDSPAAGTLGENSAGAEPTLGDRMIALEKKALATDEGLPDSDVIPTATTVTVLAKQAVQSEDYNMLASLLTRSANSLIAPTIKRLEHKYAAGLLVMLVHRVKLHSFHANALEWIKAILQLHAGYLMSSPGMRQHLSALHQIVDSRVGHFSSLLALAGRMKILVSQMQMKKRMQSSHLEEGPKVVYRIGESEGEESDVEIDAENVGLEGIQIQHDDVEEEAEEEGSIELEEGGDDDELSSEEDEGKANGVEPASSSPVSQ